LFNPNNTSATLPTVASTVDVAGNMTIGSAYAGVNAAPKDGLIVQGNVGIGTTVPAFPLQINQPLNGQGTISVTAGSGTVTGTGTDFVTNFNIGDVIKANGETRTISAIASSTSMTTDNWSGTYNGQYITSNTRRLTLTGNGNLYLGNVFSPSGNDGVFNIFNTNSHQGQTGMSSLFQNTYTIAPNTFSNIGALFTSTINSTNTQNWTATNSLIGLQSSVLTRGSSAGTVTGVVGMRSQIGNAASNTHITNAYMYQGAIQPFNSSIVISNLTGMLLYNLNAGTNNTGVFLDIGTAGVVSALPVGNWGIYDNTGYNNYFAGNVVIGTNAMPTGYKFAVAGGAIAESMTVKLQANWPDYTFKNDYKLMPLAELKTYVDKNQHLPEIPSAAQVEKDGINLGEMNRLLLKKVEELTLYLIEKDKEMKLLEDRLQKLENKQK